MQMLTIVCREQYEDEVLALFDTLNITGYTVIHGVGGSGETGAVSVTHTEYQKNKLLLVALEEARMGTLVRAMRDLRTQLMEEQSGHPVAFKAFLHSCESVL